MSKPYIILETIRQYLIDNKTTIVPEDKIFIAQPNQAFVGEGPVICIYLASPNREVYVGDDRFWDSTKLTETVMVDVLVDDMYNDVTITEALRGQLNIRDSIERDVYGNRVGVMELLRDKGVDVLEYHPDNSEDYRIDTENGVMVGTSVPISIVYVEEWLRKSTTLTPIIHDVDILTETTIRELVVDARK